MVPWVSTSHIQRCKWLLLILPENVWNCAKIGSYCHYFAWRGDYFAWIQAFAWKLTSLHIIVMRGWNNQHLHINQQQLLNRHNISIVYTVDIKRLLPLVLLVVPFGADTLDHALAADNVLFQLLFLPLSVDGARHVREYKSLEKDEHNSRDSNSS